MRFGVMGIKNFLNLDVIIGQIVAELYMPVLFVRDCDSGDGFGIGQSPNSCYGVVYFSDSLLIWFLK